MSERDVLVIGRGPWEQSTHRSVTLAGEELEAWHRQLDADAEAISKEAGALAAEMMTVRLKRPKPSLLEATGLALRYAAVESRAVEIEHRQPFKLEPVDG